MPTYSYKCTECGNAFDIQQSFSDSSLTVCPVCSGPLRKIFSAVGVTFNGSGFYRNDSRAKESSGASKGESSSKSDGASKSDSSSKSDGGSSSPAASPTKSDSGSSSSSSASKAPASTSNSSS